MSKTIGLVRISTTLQMEEHGGTGVQFQTDKLIQYSKLHELNLSKIITDVASGGLETREGIEELKRKQPKGERDTRNPFKSKEARASGDRRTELAAKEKEIQAKIAELRELQSKEESE